MMTWTVRLSGPLKQNYAVVTAESVAVAILLLEVELHSKGHYQKILPTQFIPMVTSTRKVRLLLGGNDGATTH